MAAAGGDVDDYIAARADLGQEPSEHLRIRCWPAVLRVACVQVHNCRPGLGGADGILRDLARGDWQMRRQRWDVYRPRDGAADYNLVAGADRRLSVHEDLLSCLMLSSCW